jgi:hypothetical protein
MQMYKDIFTNLQQTQGHGRWEFEYNNIIQCVFPVGRLKDILPQEFVEQFNLLKDHLIGAECIPANSTLDGHIDHIRKSNLLINVSDSDAVIFHNNNGKLEEQVIAPGDMFLINTQKEHGSTNNHDYDYKFLTLNTKLSYAKTKEYFNV